MGEQRLLFDKSTKKQKINCLDYKLIHFGKIFTSVNVYSVLLP